ncbi:MAG: hypothetical protein A2Y40_01625 [Candidatus Margulisbacteria bacterium GWF2_35_9]|nr:MAG: hypothetical protein A2Y40_01625 [Candidatus Margulisbacteria bacterium GWF2_35_9]
MNKEEIKTHINKVLSCSMATIENGKPRVRGIMLYKADDRGIIFHTGKMKDLYKQLKANPNAEICILDPQTFVQVRVSGQFEELNDDSLKDEIINAPGREFIKKWIEAGKFKGKEDLAVFTMKTGKAFRWSMANNFDKKELVDL